jgi:hypothetical protein
MSIDNYQEIAKAGRTLMLKEPFYGLFLMPELVLASLFEARIYLLEFD